MEKSRFKIRKKREFPFGILLLGGFLLGSMLPNLLWRAQWRQNTAASLYLLFCFADRSVSGVEYFLEVLRIRGGFAPVSYTHLGDLLPSQADDTEGIEQGGVSK